MGLEDMKKFVESAVEKIKSDPNLKEEFLADPVKTLEKVLNVDLPDEQVKAIVEVVKAKVASGTDGAGKVAHGFLDEVKGFFHHEKK